VESRIPTRAGDGSLISMTRSELRSELEAGTLAAATRAKVPPLTGAELDHLLEIWASPARFSAVDIGDEVVLTYDGSGSKTVGTRTQDLLIYEQMMGADSVELGHVDYSFKAIKTILGYEAQCMKDVQLVLTAPVMYGAMPNLGLYSQPDGPAPNWSELLPMTRIRRHQLRHRRRRRRRRLPGNAPGDREGPRGPSRHGHPGRDGGRVRPRHAR
jgi:dimethylamine--corrinoid protein Co-methyltransferase